jgi:type II secretory pathway predicted ATPase ExeA
MYERHFGFTENPFRLTPDPHYLYLSEGHKEALASLIWGVQARTGFVAVLGEAGTGKTTLLRHLLGRIDQTVKTVNILNTNVAFEEMLDFVLRDLGIECAGPSKTEALEAFNHFVHAEFDAGRNVVILVDEAQNLSATALEELRLLSNFETTKVKLVQIILAGQPRLSAMLANSELQQIRQRLSLVCALDPLTPRDTAAYIAHRLRVAGYRGKRLFTKRAAFAVWKHSHGIPRLINVICGNALIATYGAGRMRIGSRLVRAIATDLERALKVTLPRQPPPRWRWRMAAALTLILAGLGVEPLLSQHFTTIWRAPSQLTYESSSVPRNSRLAPAESIVDGASPVLLRTQDTSLDSPPARSPTRDYDSLLLQLLRARVPEPLIRDPVPQLKRLTVRPGDTLSSMATSVYGEASPLVLDLVMHANPELKSLDRISVGQQLVFPHITPEGLVRRTSNGRHVIHAATVSSAARASELQAKISQQGYAVSVFPIPISASQQWFRVLVGEFDAPDGAVKFWRSMKW